MPFGEPGVYWLLLAGRVELRRTANDLEDAASRIRASCYPQADEFARREVIRPRIESAMLQAFTPAADR